MKWTVLIRLALKQLRTICSMLFCWTLDSFWSITPYLHLFGFAFTNTLFLVLNAPCFIVKGKYTPQYQWLEAELPKVNRSETPWLIVLMHSPWYNSYNYHYMEGESMRVMYEPWFVKYKVDVVFAGHVHAYERSVSASLCVPLFPLLSSTFHNAWNYIW